MPQLCWTNYFLDAQDYGITNTIMYQENQSTILLENNGTRSSSKRTKHINIQYVFIKDRIKHGELNIEYCPTDDCVADFFYQDFTRKEVPPIQEDNHELTSLNSP